MRFLLTTIILTMLAQPVWAVDMGRMFKYCQTLSAAGFDAGKIEDDVDQATAFAQSIAHALAPSAVLRLV